MFCGPVPDTAITKSFPYMMAKTQAGMAVILWMIELNVQNSCLASHSTKRYEVPNIATVEVVNLQAFGLFANGQALCRLKISLEFADAFTKTALRRGLAVEQCRKTVQMRLDAIYPPLDRCVLSG